MASLPPSPFDRDRRNRRTLVAMAGTVAFLAAAWWLLLRDQLAKRLLVALPLAITIFLFHALAFALIIGGIWVSSRR